MKTVTVEYKLDRYPHLSYIPHSTGYGDVCTSWVRRRWHLPEDAPRRIWMTAAMEVPSGESDLWRRVQITNRSGMPRWGLTDPLVDDEIALLEGAFKHIPGYIYLKLEYEVRQ